MNFNEQLCHLVDEALKEDVGDGDHSTLSCIPVDAKGKAVLKIKQNGILAGVEVAEKIFRYKDSASIFKAYEQGPLLQKPVLPASFRHHLFYRL